MIKSYLNDLFEKESSKDFLVSSSLLFSLGFILSIFSNVMFFIEHPAVTGIRSVSATLFLIGNIGLSIVIYKWFANEDEKLKALVSLYIIFVNFFAFLGYFIPFLFLISTALLIALIITAEKFVLNYEKVNIGSHVSYFLITLSFYTMELVTEMNDKITRR